MSLRVQRSVWFLADLEHYADWYYREANWELAERYLSSVTTTLAKLADIPTLGHPAKFQMPELADFYCVTAVKPFQKHLIFYRFDSVSIYAERAVHGSRDLEVQLKSRPE